MTRKSAPRLVDPRAGHTQEMLKIHGVPSQRERTIADQRARKIDAAADKPKKITGNIDDGTALKNALQILQVQGVVIDQTERGGKFGEQINNAMLPNADSPDFRVKTQGASDTASTTNLDPAATVSAMTDLITLGVGKWAIWVEGSAHLSHSSGASVDISTEIDGVEGTIRTVSTVGTLGHRCEAHSELIDEADWIQGEQDVNVRVRFRCATAGTTSAKNPKLITFVKRME